MEEQDKYGLLLDKIIFLQNTDYIITKIAEANALGEDIKPLVDEYKEVIEARKEAREMINQLQNNKE